MLEKQISIGLKIGLLIALIIVLHSVSNLASHLGIITDLFILLGLIQSVRFLSNKNIRKETIKNLEDFIDIEDIKSFINKLITFVSSDEKDFYNALDSFSVFYQDYEDEDQDEDESNDQDDDKDIDKLNTEPLDYI
jgi:hypothetical protein